jgi:hypothetical protein
MEATDKILIEANAYFSNCRKYRYWISRIWDRKKPIGCFICINPSKASAEYSDQTMGNCNNLTASWGWGGFYIVNLFAYIATEQKDMKKYKNKIGEENDKAINFAVENSDVIVLAWGNEYKNRGKDVLALLSGKKLYCIKKNKGGGYLHPNRINYQEHLKPIPI